MSDYINREAAKESFLNMDAGSRAPCSTLLTPEEFAEYLDEIPAADVEPVVRCRDCKYSYEDISGRCCSHGPCVGWVVLDDSFCGQGERRCNNA